MRHEASYMLKKLVPSLEVMDNIIKPLNLRCDNEPIVFYCYDKSSVVAKHINMKHYIVKVKIQDQIIELEHINTCRHAH